MVSAVLSDQSAFTAGAPAALFDVEVPEPTAPYSTDYASPLTDGGFSSTPSSISRRAGADRDPELDRAAE
jgi:hypothetical protein